MVGAPVQLLSGRLRAEPVTGCACVGLLWAPALLDHWIHESLSRDGPKSPNHFAAHQSSSLYLYRQASFTRTAAVAAHYATALSSPTAHQGLGHLSLVAPPSWRLPHSP